MKANRGAFVRDERAVSEVVGYMIALAMSSLILVASLTAFNIMRDHSSSILTDRTVREIAARVATTVEESLEAGARFPESDFERTLTLPKSVNGQGYTVELNETHVRVVAADAGPARFDPDTGTEIETLGRAQLPLIPRAGVTILCAEVPPEIEGGNCLFHSERGALTVRYGAVDVFMTGTGTVAACDGTLAPYTNEWVTRCGTYLVKD